MYYSDRRSQRYEDDWTYRDRPEPSRRHHPEPRWDTRDAYDQPSYDQREYDHREYDRPQHDRPVHDQPQYPVKPIDSWRPTASFSSVLSPEAAEFEPFPRNNQSIPKRAYHSGPSGSSGTYTPPHRRFERGPSPFSAPSSGPREPYSKSKRKGQFQPFLPPQEYIDLSRPVPPKDADKGGKQEGIDAAPGKTIPKLLVLDLNGALIYRSGSRGTDRSIYPRPYLGNFLEYLFGPRTGEKGKGPEDRAYEVFVWSSAQPHNVRAMVENGFGLKWIEGVYSREEKGGKERRKKGEGRLMGVWARDKMELDSSDYNNNVQTFKDLRKIIAHVADEPSPGRKPHKFDEKRVILLDDSPLKAVNQPWNQLIIPEFDREEHYASREGIKHPKFRSDDPPHKVDSVLLAVIGILEDLSTVENVPAWVREGGLTPNTGGLADGVRRLSLKISEQPRLEDLPSHPDFVHWYTIPAVRDYWVKRGVEALKARGIEVDHGLDEDGYRKGQRGKKQGGRGLQEHEERGGGSDLAGRSDSPVLRRSNVWSPSRPAETLPRSPPRATIKSGSRGAERADSATDWFDQ